LTGITTVLPSTAVFFHGTNCGAKSVVTRNTTSDGSTCGHYRNISATPLLLHVSRSDSCVRMFLFS